MTTPVIMPVAEVADRWTIALLKQRHQAGEACELAAQVQYYASGIDWDNAALKQLIDDLYEINALQWDTEDAIRTGAMDDCDLAEIGRLALRVRDINRKRCLVKNAITKLLGEGFLEIKKNYGVDAG